MNELKKHATKFGSDGVLETAVERNYSVDEIAELIEFCEDADFKRDTRTFKSKPKHRPGYYTKKARELLGLDPEEDE